VFFRWPESLGGYQAQLVGNPRKHLGGTGSLYSNTGAALVGVRQPLHRPGQWFLLEVIANGDNIVIKVNGKTAVNYTDSNRPTRSGSIGLEDSVSGTLIEFRKIEIKELNGTAGGTEGLDTALAQTAWGEPSAPPASQGQPSNRRSMFLSEKQYAHLEVEKADRFSANGTIAFQGAKRAWNERIKVRGKESPHAIFLHPPQQGSAMVAYDLDGKWDLLVGAVANCQPSDHIAYSGAPLTFEVEGDNQLLWRSRPVKKFDEPQSFAIHVDKVKRLRLRVRCPGPAPFAWAVWLEPRLIGAGRIPGTVRGATGKVEGKPVGSLASGVAGRLARNPPAALTW
jgi:hypothetical protein